MSKTLSKILVICAMVVIFPLMVAGTAFASFYSVEATTIVEVYAGTHSAPADAFAQVQFENDADTKFEITKGHLKGIQLKTLSNGYDFVGWYEGSLQEYLEDENVELISKDSKLNVKACDYKNLVAVFELKSYTFTWNYAANPEQMSDISTAAPEGSKSIYYWGDQLPVLSNENFDFKGWKVEGKDSFYSSAKFETSGEYSLSALAESWISHGQVEINYYDENENLLSSETVYKGETVALKDVSTLVTLQDGYEYSWRDSNGSAPSETFSIAKEYDGTEFKLSLKKEAVNYTANMKVNDVASFKGDSVSFTVENIKAVEGLFKAENWNKYSFHEVAGISYNGTTYTASQARDLVNAVVAASKTNEENPEFDVVLEKHFETFVANSIGLISNSDAIYQQGEVVEYALSGSVSYSSTGTVAQLLNIGNKTFVCDTEDDAAIVDVVGIRITWADGSYNDFNVTRETKLLDLIENVLSVKSFGNAESFIVESLTVKFA